LPNQSLHLVVFGGPNNADSGIEIDTSMSYTGDPNNVQRGQKAIFKRARLNGAAAKGQYRSEMEKEAA